MEMVALQAQARDLSVAANKLRKEKKVPCIVYGHEVKNLSVSCDLVALHKAFVKAGESTLIELDVDGKKLPVLLKDIDFHPVSGQEIHADFYVVNMKEEIETPVPVKLVGDAPAIKDLGGILVTPMSEVTVRCLPSDLPHELELSIAGLVQFGDSASVKDIKLPKGVIIMEGPDTVLATIQEPRKEEVIEVVAAVPAEGAAVAPGAEGAAPAADGAAAPAAGAEKKDAKK